MARPDIKVRLAQNDEAEIVQALFDDVFQMGDWNPTFEAIFPHWLVAEIAGEVVGTINIRISMPISSIEFLSIDPKLRLVDRTRVTRMLLDSAIAICGASGSQGVSSMIPDELESYREMLEDCGHQIGSHGVMVVGRIR